MYSSALLQSFIRLATPSPTTTSSRLLLSLHSAYISFRRPNSTDKFDFSCKFRFYYNITVFFGVSNVSKPKKIYSAASDLSFTSNPFRRLKRQVIFPKTPNLSVLPPVPPSGSTSQTSVPITTSTTVLEMCSPESQKKNEAFIKVMEAIYSRKQF